MVFGFSYKTTSPRTTASLDCLSDQTRLNLSTSHTLLFKVKTTNTRLFIINNTNTTSMSRSYSVTEPHPSVVKGAYLGSGRGGAGNYVHYSDATLTSGPNATGPPARVELTRPKVQRTVFAGRGGAGNMYKSSRAHYSPEPEVFQFDEELMKRRESVPAPMYHIGRGGAANFVVEKPNANRMNSTASVASVSSERSTSSSVRRSVEGAFSKLSKRLSKN